MKTIYKYPIAIDDHVRITMPRGSIILTAQMQAGLPHLWVLSNAHAAHVRFVVRTLRIVGTGHPVPFDLPYIATVQDVFGLVWHIFDGGEEA